MSELDLTAYSDWRGVFAFDRGLVVVVYTEREDDLIRIIGARLANKREQALYRSYMGRYK
jgi:uncharacterized DUF497 family protein